MTATTPTSIPWTLVLLCGDLERTVPGLELAPVAQWLSDHLETVRVIIEGGLCKSTKGVREAIRQAGAQRLVLGLCSKDYSDLELQAQARGVGLDPLGIQVVDLGSYCRGAAAPDAKARLMLVASVARARAFPGSRPENTKAVLQATQQKVSRRSLFTLPPVTYQSVPTVNEKTCAAESGCDQCVQACPYEALEKDGSVIRVNRASCQSCGVCVAACPYRAVEFPGWSPQEVEAQLSAFLEAQGDMDSQTLVFICRSAFPPIGGNWLPVVLPCIAMVPVAAILSALGRGAKAVALGPCGDNCPTRQIEMAQGRVDYCRQLLQLLGDSPERVRLLMQKDPEPPPLLPSFPGERSTSPLTVFGRGEAAHAVRELAARYGAKELVLSHPYSPLGLVQIDDQACTGCGACAVGCPTGALSYEQQDDGVALTFDPCLCSGCGRCFFLCPERASDAIAMSLVTDLQRLSSGPQVLFRDQEVRCQQCGSPVASRKMLERVAAMLGNDYNFRGIERICPNCRGVSVFKG